MSAEFAALMASTQLEREKADGIRSLVASRLAAGYQHRAEVAEAALARVHALIDPATQMAQPLYGSRFFDEVDIRAAMKGKPWRTSVAFSGSSRTTPPAPSFTPLTPSGHHAAKEASDVVHDQLCESGRLSAISGSFGPSKGCQCASRAWLRDPLLDDVTPIWTPIWARNTEDQ